MTTDSQPKDFAWLPLAAVRPWQKNPRRNAHAIEPVARSLRRFGFVTPIVIWTSGDRMVAGHTRVLALEALLKEDAAFTPRGAPGPGLVPVRFQDFDSEAEADAYSLADNRLSEIATWDEPGLVEILHTIHDQDAALLQDIGWGEADLMRLLADPADVALPPEADGKPYDEDVADDVEFIECPACRHRWPK